MSKQDKFRRLISNAEPEKAVDDMAKLVMQQITASADDEVAVSLTLKKLLQQHGADAAPMAFTQKVMTQINPQQVELSYKPIITKKAWYAIAASVLGILILSAWPGGSGQHIFATDIGGNAIRQVNTLPAVYVITLILGGLLLVAEHFITNRLKLNKS